MRLFRSGICNFRIIPPTPMIRTCFYASSSMVMPHQLQFTSAKQLPHPLPLDTFKASDWTRQSHRQPSRPTVLPTQYSLQHFYLPNPCTNATNMMNLIKFRPLSKREMENYVLILHGLPGSTMVKNALEGRSCWFDPWVGISSGVGNGNPFQYSCLENSIDRGALWATVHRVAKSWNGHNRTTNTFTFRHEIRESAF